MAQEFEIPGQGPDEARPTEISDQILDLLQKNVENPGDAFVLLQQLTIYVWDQFKIDWNNKEGHPVAATRKQRYLDYVGALIDNLKTNDMLVQQED